MRYVGNDPTLQPVLGAFFIGDQTVNADITIPVGQNALSAGPITIATGRTVTVSTGSTWSII